MRLVRTTGNTHNWTQERDNSPSGQRKGHRISTSLCRLSVPGCHGAATPSRRQLRNPVLQTMVE